MKPSAFTVTKTLQVEGKQSAVDQFVSGRDMATIASYFGVSRKHIEQCAREALIGLAALVPKPEPPTEVLSEESHV